MADPRSTTTNRVGTEPRRPLTFKADGSDIVYSATAAGGSAVVGRAVLISGNGVVRLTGAGSAVHGKLLQVEPDGYCTVECGSVVTLPKGDGAITAGDRVCGDLQGANRGYVRSAVAAEVLVAAGFVLDASTATAVEIMLGA